MSIISVGYHYNFTPETITEIYRAIGARVPGFNPEQYPIESRVSGGIWYSSRARHMRPDSVTTDESLTTWYRAHQNVTTMFLRSVYIQKKLLIGVFSQASDVCFIILSNQTRGSATTIHKKACCDGHYGPAIDVDRVAVSVTAYID